MAETKKLQKAYNECGGVEQHLQTKLWSVELVDDSNLYLYKARIIGPDNTPYAGQEYELSINAANTDYPTKPPAVKFVKKIPYHANVYRDGKICVDILQDQWSAAFKMENILLSLLILLDAPNTSSPANGEAAKAYDNDATEGKQMFASIVRQKYDSS